MQDRNGNPNKKNSLKKYIGGGGGQSRGGQDFLSAQMMRAFCEVWKTKGDQNNMKVVWSKRAPVSVYSLSLSCSWLFSFLQATLCCRQVQFLCLAVGYFPVFTPHFVSTGAVPLFCSWLFSCFHAMLCVDRCGFFVLQLVIFLSSHHTLLSTGAVSAGHRSQRVWGEIRTNRSTRWGKATTSGSEETQRYEIIIIIIGNLQSAFRIAKRFTT